MAVSPALAWTQASPRDVQNLVTTLGSLAVGPSPPSLRRSAVEAIMEIMADLAGSSLDEEADVARSLGTALCVVQRFPVHMMRKLINRSTALIDVGRQALFDMEALDLEGLERTAMLIRDMVVAMLSLVRVYPEVCPSNDSSFLLCGVCTDRPGPLGPSRV